MLILVYPFVIIKDFKQLSTYVCSIDALHLRNGRPIGLVDGPAVHRQSDRGNMDDNKVCFSGLKL